MVEQVGFNLTWSILSEDIFSRDVAHLKISVLKKQKNKNKKQTNKQKTKQKQKMKKKQKQTKQTNKQKTKQKQIHITLSEQRATKALL